MSAGIERIAAERERQVEAEGWSAEHDDRHTLGELAEAAACYALPDIAEEWWPWPDDDFKPDASNQIHDLVRAGALIAAEIDRLLRAAGGDPDGR